MALSRRSGRDRKLSDVEVETPGTGGSSPAERPKLLDRDANEGLHRVLLQQGVVTKAQLEQAWEVEPQSATDVGEVLVQMGALSERDLVQARAELYDMDLIDLGSTNPEPEALDLIPDSMAREHYLIPMAVDEDSLAVALADRPRRARGRYCPFWPPCRTSGVPLRTITGPSAVSIISSRLSRLSRALADGPSTPRR
jgi:Type II secretion system (T2SS), protein E, N-terminal domain